MRRIWSAQEYRERATFVDVDSCFFVKPRQNKRYHAAQRRTDRDAQRDLEHHRDDVRRVDDPGAARVVYDDAETLARMEGLAAHAAAASARTEVDRDTVTPSTP